MLKQKLQKIRAQLFSAYEQKKLQNIAFAIISNNCWGYELYHSIHREYNTPFIGLFLFPECYLKFLQNFDHYINAELKFISQSKYYNTEKHYPVGILDNAVEIHFLHYKNREEATEKWTRRVSRLQTALKSKTPLFVKFCDNESCTTEQLQRFHALPFAHKISIGLQKISSDQHFHTPELEDKKKGTLIDGAKLFNKRYRYFDITEWIIKDKLTRTPMTKILGLLS